MSTHTSTNQDMVDILLFEQFATLATAPDGTGRLRALILQLAVQGKLGTQDASDEPASVLLEKIRKEREKLDSYGKLKKQKTVEPVGELVCRVPNGWVYTQLGKIVSFEYGKSLPEINRDDSGKIPVFGSNGIVGYHSESITKKSSLIIGRKGSAGAVQISNVPCFPIDTAYYFDSFENLDLKFIYYLLTSLKLGSLEKSTAIPGLNRNDAYSLPIGLPPLAEQHRIVAKVDRLMALCDELEARQQQERAGCLKLGTASFAGLQNAESPEEFGRQWAQVCDAFDLILDCPENVAVLRQTILQLAVQGRLVRQEPGDEPASVIIERIPEKKEHLPAEESEIPYPLPNGWIWGLLGAITKFIDYRGKTPNKVDSGIKLITAKNVRMGYLNNEPREYILPEEYDTWMTRGFPSVGDILFTTEAPMGNVAQLLIKEKIALAQRIINLHPYDGLFSTYLMYALMSPFIQSCIEEKSSGVTARGIKASKLKLISIPLPPLAEQHRIVAKVDALMALCDQLEAQLKERAGMQGKFTDAVVKSIGTG